MTRIIGVDPGLQATGWGIIEKNGQRLSFIASGTIRTPSQLRLAKRLLLIHEQLNQVLTEYCPHLGALEETFLNKNARASLTLGQARGAVLLTLARHGFDIHDYAPRLVKKTVVGVGNADKEQIQHMVKILLPHANIASHDAADALAIAICHAHHC
jgi:crossover junction endodeoxyribonuclease RuvC